MQFIRSYYQNLKGLQGCYTHRQLDE